MRDGRGAANEFRGELSPKRALFSISLCAALLRPLTFACFVLCLPDFCGREKRTSMIFADKELSQRLERTEGSANRAFVDARARISPEARAEWIEVAGAYVMFDGPESPLTQTFGLGLCQEATHDDLERIEAFFAERGAPVFHEVSPHADSSILQLFDERGYRPIELTNVLFQEIDAIGDSASGIATRIISNGEEELWARTSAAGWSSEMEELGEFMFNFGRIGAASAGCHSFIAEIDGVPAATGALYMFDEVAILAGASTIAGFRRRGAQTALLAARLNAAAENGCGIAMMGATPGSQSQRNAEKNGFRVAYTRTKWMKR